MKFYSGQSLFQFPVDQVMIGFWRRYPNPFSKHVLTEDVIERKLVGDQLITKRLICKTNSIPHWAERFVQGCRHVYVLEESIVDPVKKTIVTYTRNIGLQKYMTVIEKCTYRGSEDQPGWVACERFGWVNSAVPGFSSVIARFGLQRFRSNVSKAVDGFNYVLKTLNAPELLTDKEKEIGKKTSEKFKESAKKASEIAKSKAEIAKSKAEMAKAKVPRPVQQT